jgi:hypothetical protein
LHKHGERFMGSSHFVVGPRRRILIGFLAALTLVLNNGISANAQVFVVGNGTGTIGEYSLSGGTINPSIIPGLTSPSQNNSPWQARVQGNNLWLSTFGFVSIVEYSISSGSLIDNPFPGTDFPATSTYAFDVQGNDLFFVDSMSGNLSEYDTSGDLVNSSLGTAPAGVRSVRIYGNDIFVWTNPNDNGLRIKGDLSTISEFTTSGATVNTSLVETASQMSSFAVAGDDIFVTNFTGTVAEYTTSGAFVNSFVVPGFNDIFCVAVDGDDLLLDNNEGNDSVIGEYSMTGTPINPSFITGPTEVSDIEVVVPEPASTALIAMSAVAALHRRRGTRSK